MGNSDTITRGLVIEVPKLSFFKRLFCFCKQTKKSATRTCKYYSDIAHYQCVKCGRWWIITRSGDTAKLLSSMFGGKY